MGIWQAGLVKSIFPGTIPNLRVIFAAFRPQIAMVFTDNFALRWLTLVDAGSRTG